jgi:hypothetical protein
MVLSTAPALTIIFGIMMTMRYCVQRRFDYTKVYFNFCLYKDFTA